MLKSNDSKVEFAGDDFDKIFCKYLSKQKQGLELSFDFRSRRSYLANLFHAESDGLDSSPVHFESEEEEFRGVDWSRLESVENSSQLIALDPKLAIKLDSPGWMGRTVESHKQVLFEVEAEFDRQNCSRIYVVNVSDGQDALLDELKSKLGNAKAKAMELGGKFDYRFHEWFVSDAEALVEQVKHLESSDLKAEWADNLCHRMFYQYLSEENREKSFQTAKHAAKFSEFLDPDDINNLGYILMRASEAGLANQVLEASSSKNENSPGALFTYNLAISKAVTGKGKEAIECFQEAIELNEVSSIEAVVMLRLDKLDSELKITEIGAPDESIAEQDLSITTLGNHAIRILEQD